jgi:CRISPR-associated protein Csm1
MLILASLSGIQDYLFDVHETGGGQAKTLRARSFQIQIISECIAMRLLHAIRLPLTVDQVALRAAAKFAIADVNDSHRADLNSVLVEIHRWLLKKTHGRLRLSVVFSNAEQSTADSYSDALRQLKRSKLIPWWNIAVDAKVWKNERLVTDVFDKNAQAEEDKRIGKDLTNAKYLHYFSETTLSQKPDDKGFDAAGLRVCLTRDVEAVPGAMYDEGATRFLFHVPTKNGEVIDFESLANYSRGAPMLGVLKADVDSLGQAVDKKLHGVSSLQPLQALSEQLNKFFGEILNDEMRKDNVQSNSWKNLYTVFSGGDDILLVGPWDIAIDFAGHIQQLFNKRFGGNQEGLTISAGLSIVKPKFPIRLAAQDAEALLKQAKGNQPLKVDTPKDRFAVLGDMWKWKDHKKIIDAGKQLAHWVDTDVVQHGWLQTLLELTLLRRSKPESVRVHPATATSRLAYHIERNWPKAQKKGDLPPPARAWINKILREFDWYETTPDIETIYLPAIVRYAMLATREREKEEKV